LVNIQFIVLWYVSEIIVQTGLIMTGTQSMLSKSNNRIPK